MQDLIQAGIDNLALLGAEPRNRDIETQANADKKSISSIGVGCETDEKAKRFVISFNNISTDRSQSEHFDL